MSLIYLPTALGNELSRRNLPSTSLAQHRDAAINPTLHALKMDAARTNWLGRKGDLVVFLSEKDFQDGNGVRPCMLIAHANNPKQRHVFFPMRDLWLILEKNPEQYAYAMCEKLYGGHTTKDDAYRVLDCLFDFAEDVKNAKPPRWLSNRQWLEACGEDGIIISKDGVALNG